MRSFQKDVANFTNNEILTSSNVSEWNALFKVLINNSNEKIVIVIDEFQYLGKANCAFPSIFQKIWDLNLKDKNIMVILCGSYISMMESQTLAYSSPLYGRRTGQIKLKQIEFKYYRDFHPHVERKNLIELYSITGGVPKYIEMFEAQTDIFDAINNNILSKSSFLYDEPNFLLRNEVSEVGTYFSIIKTIAEGNRKLSKIATRLEVQQSNLSKYLKTLQQLDIIEREVPVTEDKPEKSKKGQYIIKDNYIKFWFLFIYPNKSYLETNNSGIVLNKIKENFIDRHVAFVYENVCVEKMWELNNQEIWNFNFNKVGRWWNNNSEIDLVAIDSEGDNIIFGECKYQTSKVGINILAKLEEKAKSVIYKNDIRNDYYVLFSISGFTDELIVIANNRNDVYLSE